MSVTLDLLRWLKKFLLHHRPALVGFSLLTIILFVAVFAPFLTEFIPSERAGEPTLETSFKHPLGVDSQGYDLWARITYGARTTLLIALSATVLSLILGTLMGGLSGFLGGLFDLIVMRAIDFLMTFPGFLLAMVLVAIVKELTGERSLSTLIYAVGIVQAPLIARQVRAEVIRVASLDYTAAAKALGMSRLRIFLRHVLPNSIGPIIVLGTLGMGTAILDVAGLNFLGLGADAYVYPEWGVILQQGWEKSSLGILQVTVSGVAIFVTVLGFNLLGDGLKDELDPRTRKR